MMNQNIKISIIIPVYNTEKYVEKCINSIRNQSYKNLEIIIIDDGSTDDSSLICTNLSNKDERIVYKKIKNGGVSNARNYGINISTGDYISFVDSDDYISNDYIEKLVKIAIEKNSQIVVCGLTEVTPETEQKISIYKEMKERCKDITFPKKIEDYLLTFEFNSACSQLISKELININNIEFNKNINYGEDMLFSLDCYINSKKTYYLKQYGYYYIRNDNSAMGKVDTKSINKYYDDNLNSTNIILNKYKFCDELKDLIYIKSLNVFNGISTSLIKNIKKYKSVKKIILNNRDKYNKIFNNMSISKFKSKKEKLIYFLLNNKFILIYYLLKKIK